MKRQNVPKVPDTEGKFMVAVGAVIEHAPTGKILVLRRSDTLDYAPGAWQIPYGRMKQFEEIEAALRREVEEETGLSITIKGIINYFHNFREEKIADKEQVGLVFWATTEDDGVVLSAEHSAYKWVTVGEAIGYITDAGVQSDVQAYVREKK